MKQVVTNNCSYVTNSNYSSIYTALVIYISVTIILTIIRTESRKDSEIETPQYQLNKVCIKKFHE